MTKREPDAAVAATTGGPLDVDVWPALAIEEHPHLRTAAFERFDRLAVLRLSMAHTA
jgi:hypothetical protein